MLDPFRLVLIAIAFPVLLLQQVSLPQLYGLAEPHLLELESVLSN